MEWLIGNGYLIKEQKLYKITPAGEEIFLNLEEICTILNIDEAVTEDKN